MATSAKEQRAAELLRKLGDDLTSMDPSADDDGRFMQLRLETQAVIRNTWGDESPQMRQFLASAQRTPVVRWGDHDARADAAHIDQFYQAKQRVIAVVKGLVFELETAQSQPLEADSGRTAARPKVFIAHGGMPGALERLATFVDALGLEPVILEKQANVGRSKEDKLAHYLEQCHCAIVFATADDLINGRLQARGNVLHEIGRFQERFPGRVIYLLEKEASFPSNIDEKVWERFSRRNLETAFIRVAQELRAFGMLRTTLPAE